MKIFPILYIVAVMLLCTIRTYKSNSKSYLTNDSLPKSEVRQKAMEKNNSAILMNRLVDNLDTLNKAACLLGEAIVIDSSYKLAYTNLAQLQVEMGKVEEGVSTLWLVHQKYPNDETILFGLGEYYDLLQETDSAQKYYNKSLDIYNRLANEYPDSIPILLNKHFVLSIMKDDNAILANFEEEYRRKYPSNPIWQLKWSGFDKKEFLIQHVREPYRANLQKQVQKRYEKGKSIGDKR